MDGRYAERDGKKVPGVQSHGDIKTKGVKPGCAEVQGLDEKLSRPVSSVLKGLPYSTSRKQALEKKGIRTVFDLVRLSEDDLLKIESWGPKSVDALKNELEPWVCALGCWKKCRSNH